MKTIGVANLRNRLRVVFKWIEAGEQVEITKGGRVAAWIVPAPLRKPRRFKIPPFAARATAILGSSFAVGHNLVEEERNRSLVQDADSGVLP